VTISELGVNSTWVQGDLRSEYLARSDSFKFASNFSDVVRQYRGSRNAQLIAAASSATILGSLFLAVRESNGDGTAVLSNDVRDAFHLAYPHVSLEDLLSNRSDDVGSYLNGWSGKLFEVRVVDALNSGHAVGDLVLNSGQTAALAASPIQQGWDIRIEPEGDLFQLKASESLSYLKESVQKVGEFDPEIGFIVTDDLANFDLDDLHVSDMSVGDLRDEIISEVDNLDDSVGWLDEIGDALGDVVPFVFTFLTVKGAYRQGKRIVKMRNSGLAFKQIAELETAEASRRLGNLLSPIPFLGRAVSQYSDHRIWTTKLTQQLSNRSDRILKLLELMKVKRFRFGKPVFSAVKS